MVAIPYALATLCLINRWWRQRDCYRQHERSHRPNTVAAIAGALCPRALAATSDDRAGDGGRRQRGSFSDRHRARRFEALRLDDCR
jgi:hypothetical protein